MHNLLALVFIEVWSNKFLDQESFVRYGPTVTLRQKRGTTKVRVACTREIQRPMAAADFIRDRLLGVKLKAKKVCRGLKARHES